MGEIQNRESAMKKVGLITIIVLFFFGVLINKSSEDTHKQNEATAAALAANNEKMLREHPEIAKAQQEAQAKAAAAQAKASAMANVKERNFQRAVAGARTLRGMMRDPDSFRLTDVHIIAEDQKASGAVCYEYRSKNGFGGYTQGQAVLTTKGKIVADSAAGWNAVCPQMGYSELHEVEIAAGWRGLLGGENY